MHNASESGETPTTAPAYALCSTFLERDIEVVRDTPSATLVSAGVGWKHSPIRGAEECGPATVQQGGGGGTMWPFQHPIERAEEAAFNTTGHKSEIQRHLHPRPPWSVVPLYPLHHLKATSCV